MVDTFRQDLTAICLDRLGCWFNRLVVRFKGSGQKGLLPCIARMRRSAKGVRVP
jgi:hypothetical protein